MEDMRCGVISTDAVATQAVYRRFDVVALGDHTDADRSLVHRLTRKAVLRIGNVHDGARCGRDRPGVADLATRFRVERCAVEHDADFAALAPFADLFTF